MDFAENSLVTLFYSGEVKVYDLKTNSLKSSGKIIEAVAKDEKQKPQLVATQRSLYITLPKTGELLKVETAKLTNSQKVKVSITPFRIAILGAEINRKGDD
jgi:hypothetical protein